MSTTTTLVVAEVALGEDKGMEKEEKDEEDINHRDTAHIGSS